MRMLALFFIMALPAWAEDWTVNGKDYHNVVVGQIEAEYVHVMYDGGLGRIAIADLTPELQKRFNYDPEKAKEAHQAEAAHFVEVDRVQTRNAAVRKKEDDSEKLSQSSSYHWIEVIQVSPEGLLGTWLSLPPAGPPVDFSHGVEATLVRTDKTVFVRCKTSDVVDGARLNLKIFHSGTHQYENVLGSSRTVEEWTVVP